ncbi:MAG: VTC domain-containing protein [Magnetococcales bacterium]|nr:VTC domain-containing protein [Magnetococcales bacterium]
MEKTAPNRRFERKISIHRDRQFRLEEMIKLIPGGFSVKYEPRRVNSIYFDTLGWHMLKANIDGISKRKKVRIRWYGIESCQNIDAKLELKHKTDLLGHKDRFNMLVTELKTTQRVNGINRWIKDSQLPENIELSLSTLQPVLLVQYTRQYFSSADGVSIITLDRDLCYTPYDLRGICHIRSYKSDSLVVEIKSDEAKEDIAGVLCKYLPFRLTKNSKYVNGIEHCFAL